MVRAARALPYWWVVARANLPTFRLSGFSTCWEVGKLAGAGWVGRGGGAGWDGGLPRGKGCGRWRAPGAVYEGCVCISNRDDDEQARNLGHD